MFIVPAYRSSISESDKLRYKKIDVSKSLEEIYNKRVRRIRFLPEYRLAGVIFSDGSIAVAKFDDPRRPERLLEPVEIDDVLLMNVFPAKDGVAIVGVEREGIDDEIELTRPARVRVGIIKYGYKSLKRLNKYYVVRRNFSLHAVLFDDIIVVATERGIDVRDKSYRLVRRISYPHVIPNIKNILYDKKKDLLIIEHRRVVTLARLKDPKFIAKIIAVRPCLSPSEDYLFLVHEGIKSRVPSSCLAYYYIEDPEHPVIERFLVFDGYTHNFSPNCRYFLYLENSKVRILDLARDHYLSEINLPPIGISELFIPNDASIVATKSSLKTLMFWSVSGKFLGGIPSDSKPQILELLIGDSLYRIYPNT